MSSQNNISDLSPRPNQDVSLFALPIRAEKLFLITPTNSEGTHMTGALPGLWEYILIRIAGRGTDSTGASNPNLAAYYQFLINPASLQVSRQTLEAQSLAKGGWQFGLWGEDFITVTLEGKTPARYSNYGLSDLDTPYTLSYRNLEALEVIFENNGYWFEGEQAFDGVMGSQLSHRQIKMHTDVELMAGEFIWNGMFESLQISDNAESPFLSSFTLVFIAWNERYRAGTPYLDPIDGAVVRGHVPAGLLERAAIPANVATSPITVTQTLDFPVQDFSPVTDIMNPDASTLFDGS